VFNQVVEKGELTGMATDQLSRVFVALGDPVRRDILARLAKGEQTVNALAAPFPMSLQAVSKHLKVLQSAGLISQTRDAQRRPCRLEPAALKETSDWIQKYRKAAEEQFERLDEVLEELKGE